MNFFQSKNYSLNRLSIAKVIVGAMLFLIFLQNCRTALDPDLGWHIRTGQLILENKDVPRYDELSFTMPGHPWVDHEWLVDALLASAYERNFWFTVIGLFASIAFVPFFFWIRKAEGLLTLTAILLAGFIFSQFVAVRPQLISFALFFVVFHIIFKLEGEKKSLLSGKYKLALPLIFFVWANLHAGFFSGIILIFAYILARIIHSKISKAPYVQLRQDLSCLALCLLATLINPYGLKIYQEIFLASTSRLTVTYIQEWQPIFTHVGLNLIIFNVFLALFVLSVFALFRKINPVLLMISLLFLFLGIKSSRLIQFFIVSGLPIIFIGIDAFLEQIRNQTLLGEKGKRIIEAIVLLIFLSVFSLKLIEPAVGINYSPNAVSFLEKHIRDNGQVNIFNDYIWGGYLDLKLPQLKVFIDGRMPHWEENGNSAMEDYVEVAFKGNWEKVFAKRDIGLVFLRKFPEPKTDFFSKVIGFFFLQSDKNPDKTEALPVALSRNGWEVIYEDEVSIIMEKGA